MPELPDVETLRRYLAATALHARIRGVEVRVPKMLRGISARALRARLRGRRFERARRHGKYLFAGLDGGGWLVLHFGMTGWLHYSRSRGPEPAHVRLLIRFDRGAQLAYDDQRMLGRIAWADELDEFVRARRLGPDALARDFTAAAFRAMLVS